MPLSQRDDLCQTPRLDGANESLRVGVQIRAARRKLHGLDARGFQDLAKRLREQRISIVNEVASFVQKALVAVSEVSCDLAHPLAVGSRKDSGDLDSSGLKIDGE
jgi:hypothetical protein